MLLLAADFSNLHEILKNLYVEMMPLCSNMAGVAKGIAGLGALIYVASRVWQSLARAEPIDVYPMLRPFAIGICIMFFPTISMFPACGCQSFPTYWDLSRVHLPFVHICLKDSASSAPPSTSLISLSLLP